MLRSIGVRAKKNIFVRMCLNISQSNLFNSVIVPIFIIVNTGVLAADKFPEEEKSNNVLELINFFFYFFFLFEVLVKCYGLGTKAYF